MHSTATRKIFTIAVDSDDASDSLSFAASTDDVLEDGAAGGGVLHLPHITGHSLCINSSSHLSAVPHKMFSGFPLHVCGTYFVATAELAIVFVGVGAVSLVEAEVAVVEVVVVAVVIVVADVVVADDDAVDGVVVAVEVVVAVVVVIDVDVVVSVVVVEEVDADVVVVDALDFVVVVVDVVVVSVVVVVVVVLVIDVVVAVTVVVTSAHFPGVRQQMHRSACIVVQDPTGPPNLSTRHWICIMYAQVCPCLIMCTWMCVDARVCVCVCVIVCIVQKGGERTGPLFFFVPLPLPTSLSLSLSLSFTLSLLASCLR